MKETNLLICEKCGGEVESLTGKTIKALICKNCHLLIPNSIFIKSLESDNQSDIWVAKSINETEKE